MEVSKQKINKIKKFGKRLKTYIFSFIVSYLLSLFSFYMYTQLSQTLPQEKGFLEFAIIGLIAGIVSVLVSFISNQFMLTVVISFIIYCLIDSFSLFPQLGIQVIQFIPGLLISISTVVASGYFLKRKLGFTTKIYKTLPITKEHIFNEHILARKLIENPNKLTLGTFKEACGLLQGIDPKIDAVLKKADYFSRALTFLNGDDAIGFVASNIKVKTKEDEEKKKKLLFFIDLVKNIREEVNTAIVRLDTVKAEGSSHPVRQLDHSTVANMMTTLNGTSAVITVGIVTVMATTIVVANSAGITPGIPPLQNNKFQEATQNSQDTNTSGITGVVVSSVTPTATPTIAPTLAITVDNGWGHFTRIISGPPGSDTTSTLDTTTIAVYASIHNNGTTTDRLIGAISEFCKYFTMQDMNPNSSSAEESSINITIPAKNTLELKFMGQRLICHEVNGVKQGDHVPIGLVFEKFGQIPVLIEIRATPN